MMIAIGGMSGSGKTTLAANLMKILPGAVNLDSDRIRRELWGVSETEYMPPEAHSSQMTGRVIEAMAQRARQALAEGKNVIVSATLMTPPARRDQELAAKEKDAAFVGIWLQTDLAVLFDRVTKRVNNVSDAGVEVVKRQQRAAGYPVEWPVIDAGQSEDAVVNAALKMIADAARKPVVSTARPRGLTAV